MRSKVVYNDLEWSKIGKFYQTTCQALSEIARSTKILKKLAGISPEIAECFSRITKKFVKKKTSKFAKTCWELLDFPIFP